ncbi:uncharacterized protein SAPINGB_P004200 [Magnusiomyces paraingens]|uniref:AAA+ ATPase domain-containing protein n=1 Tax=Magnusiomyces paraingens TaxID=2606893 RepID=A0A5E8BT70_9ASCO|nr:uncharacterized protein SAPINGB_P004200 [Saprochaete ingens]VVT54686.1 unnamed protein product [Saprochaete ingens]
MSALIKRSPAAAIKSAVLARQSVLSATRKYSRTITPPHFALTQSSFHYKFNNNNNNNNNLHLLFTSNRKYSTESSPSTLSEPDPALERKLVRDPVSQYDFLVANGKIRNDPHQRLMLSNLSSLHEELLAYTPPKIEVDPPASSSSSSSGFSSFFGKLLGSSSSNSETSLKSFQGPSTLPIGCQPNGIYLFGDVGSGKTMLMDMFYTTVPPHLTKKRIHFHAFMQDVHKRSFRLHQLHGQDYDTAPTIAREIASEANVLCFDEFQVTDVADAMILRRILENLYSPQLGTVIFMTSNRVPDELYKDGIQRKSFIPTIELIKLKSHVMYLDSPTDYRKIERPSQGTYFSPPHGKTLDDVREEATAHADRWFHYFAHGKPAEYNVALHIWGRPVNIPKCVVGAVAQFSFKELCETPMSAADYLEITRNFDSIVITDIPLLSVRERDVTRRFITFLDAAYESHTKMAVTSARPFEHIFIDEIPTYGQKSRIVLEAEEKARKEAKEVRKEALEDDENDDILSKENMFSGEEERFAFARALSRLKQMASKEWHEYVVPK